MGTSFEFRCPACGYEASVSGGADYGMACATQTVLCRACEEVLDVVTHGHDLGNWPPKDTRNLVSTAAPLRCPEGESHEVVKWSRRRPCPKCGERMEKGEEFILWD